MSVKPSESKPFDWAGFLSRHRDAIISEWVQRLHSEISERYSHRPQSELRRTIGGSFSANCTYLIDGEKGEQDRFIMEISRLRLEGGFPLVDVQKAFDLFRHIVLPLLPDACTLETFHGAVVELNDCMAYTIYQFSDLFQKLHSQRLTDIAQMATSLSHEIRNPLSAIKLNLQILQRCPDLVGNDRRRVAIAVNEMLRLEGVLQEVLDFAKPVMLEKNPCSLNPILLQVVELLEMKFAEKRLDVQMDLDEVPDILMDGKKMEQVVLNLLLNAVDAAPEGSAIRLSSFRRNSAACRPEVVFSVEDEGETIPPGLCETIFKPFFTTKSRGVGLGLSVVRRLVEAHGGSVSVAGRPPGGSVFTVTLPEGNFHANDTRGR